MIVKVQIPIESNMPPEEYRALVYDETRSLEVLVPITDGLREAMGSHVKQYWYAHTEGDHVVLDGPAPWQKW